MTQHAISKAEALEEKGLWRRAATQWLNVMQKTLTDEQREQVRRRRMFCLSQVKKTERPKEPNLAEVNRAANETQRRLGIEWSKKDFTRNAHASAGQHYRSPGYFPGKYINRDS